MTAQIVETKNNDLKFRNNNFDKKSNWLKAFLRFKVRNRYVQLAFVFHSIKLTNESRTLTYTGLSCNSTASVAHPTNI